MKTKRITKLGKMIIFGFFFVVIALGMYLGGAFDYFSKSNSNTITSSNQLDSNSNSTVDNNNTYNTSEVASNSNEINLSISERIGWKPILDANGGLTTQPGSIYDKLGLKVNIKVDNNTTTSSKDFIDNKVNALGYTVNRFAGVYKQFNDAGVEPVMPYIVSSSVGGDGIIVRGNINTVADFANHKIGVPNLAAGQTLVWWLMLKSDLTEDQLAKIKKNIVIYDNTVADSEAFFKGEVDIAVTKQPYLNMAKNGKDTKVLFTTKSASNLVLDGIVFKKDFVENNKETVNKFVDGALQAIGNPTMDNIRYMNIFKEKTDDELKQMLTETKITDYTGNHNLLNGMAQNLFEDMANVWEKAGGKVVHGVANNAISMSVINDLKGKYSINTTSTTAITESQKQKAMADSDALLKKSTTINFKPNSANFLNSEEAQKALNEFVDIAKFLDGSVIQIEGNIANAGGKDDKAADILSKARAKAVADYLHSKGIEQSRFIVIGNGGKKQIAPNTTEENKKKNRRTDIFFKIVEE